MIFCFLFPSSSLGTQRCGSSSFGEGVPKLELGSEGKLGNEGNTGKVIVRVNPAFYRPAEVDFLLGDASKAKERLGSEPTVRFGGLVEMMARADMERAARGELQPLHF